MTTLPRPAAALLGVLAAIAALLAPATGSAAAAHRAADRGCRAGHHLAHHRRKVACRPVRHPRPVEVPAKASGASSVGGEAPVATVPTPPAEGSTPTPSPSPVASVPGPVAPPAQAAGETAPSRFFAPTSFWNEPDAAEATVDPESAAVVGALVQTVEAEAAEKRGPAINTTEWSVPVYTVPAGQPTVAVTLEAPYSAPGLRAAFAAVPLPPGAEPARGNDRHLVVWQPSTDRLWEFWHLRQAPSGWQADWGGAMEHVSQDSGVYEPGDWPEASAMWGASASSLSIAGGLIAFTDLEAGRIEHALEMSVPAARAGVHYAPAARSDGESPEATALPEGAHLRIDPSLDLASLGLPHLTLMMAEAAQRYGIYVRDVAGNVAFNAQDPVGPTNPYLGPSGWFEGSYPQKLLARFPWSSLELLTPGSPG
jgi:hypothetical protein